MSYHTDLLEQAEHLARRERKRPRQASLRRSVSASYYALFHLLVDEAVGRMFRGNDRAALRDCMARAFSHRDMFAVARQFASGGISAKLLPSLNGLSPQPELIVVAEAFCDLQQARHEADYNRAGRFTRRQALGLQQRARHAFSEWRKVRTSLQADAFLAALLAYGSLRGG